MGSSWRRPGPLNPRRFSLTSRAGAAPLFTAARRLVDQSSAPRPPPLKGPRPGSLGPGPPSPPLSGRELTPGLRLGWAGPGLRVAVPPTRAGVRVRPRSGSREGTRPISGRG